MELNLQDKTVLIAGSSRGIGLAIAEAFLGEGAQVVITGRDPLALERAEESFAARFDSPKLRTFKADMTISKEIADVVRNSTESYGSLDIAIANVGSGTAKSGWNLDLNDWEEGLRVNLTGSMIFAGEVIPYLVESKGVLLFISSIAGCEAINAPITYSAAKAGIQSAVKNLSRILGPQGVRVNAILPGNVLFPGGSWERKLSEKREFFEQYINTEVPLQRFGCPEEIADAAIFLASERAAFITGASLVVDGGQTRSFF